MSFWKDHVKPMRQEFHRVFPKVFTREGDKNAKKKPLKIGIHLDLFEAFPTIDRKLIRLALFDYVQGGKYLQCCFDGASRVDLQGNECGVVRREHRLHLVEAFEKRKRMFERMNRDKGNTNSIPNADGNNRRVSSSA